MTATVDSGPPAAVLEGYVEIATQPDRGVVRSGEDLGAGIDPESLDFLAGDAAAGMVGGLQDQEVDPAPAQGPGGCQSGRPGADDDYRRGWM